MCNKDQMAADMSLWDRFLLASCPLSDAQLAARLGIARTTVWRARTGRTKLSRYARDRLIALLDENGEAERDARAVEALLDLAVTRADVRSALLHLSNALLRDSATP